MTEITSKECCFRTSGQPFEKAVWEVTFNCSLKCSYCFQERTSHKNGIPKAELSKIREKVIDFLSFLSPKHILISGGEPLTLGTELYRIIESIKSIGVSRNIKGWVQITT